MYLSRVQDTPLTTMVMFWERNASAAALRSSTVCALIIASLCSFVQSVSEGRAMAIALEAARATNVQMRAREYILMLGVEQELMEFSLSSAFFYTLTSSLDRVLQIPVHAVNLTATESSSLSKTDH